jgi:hypothetical protein
LFKDDEKSELEQLALLAVATQVHSSGGGAIPEKR